jgi:hypothetical protein
VSQVVSELCVFERRHLVDKPFRGDGSCVFFSPGTHHTRDQKCVLFNLCEARKLTAHIQILQIAKNTCIWHESNLHMLVRMVPDCTTRKGALSSRAAYQSRGFQKTIKKSLISVTTARPCVLVVQRERKLDFVVFDGASDFEAGFRVCDLAGKSPGIEPKSAGFRPGYRQTRGIASKIHP